MAKIKLTPAPGYTKRPLNISDPELYRWMLSTMIQAGLRLEKCHKPEHGGFRSFNTSNRQCNIFAGLHVRI